MRRAVVTGLGAITPFGTVEEMWHRIRRGDCAVAPCRNFETRGMPRHHAAEIAELDAEVCRANPSEAPFVTRHTKLLLGACRLAMHDAGLDTPNGATGLVCGSAFGNFQCGLAYAGRLIARSRLTPMDAFEILPNSQSNYATLRLGLRALNRMVASGLCSGIDAIGQALLAIRSGTARRALAAGVDDLYPEIFLSLGLQGVLAGGDGVEEVARPYDRRRTGFVAAEAAAALLVEDLETARARGARIYAELTGYAARFSSGNPLSATRHALILAVSGALADSGLTPPEIDYVCGAANGSRLLDWAERSALSATFGQCHEPPLVSSIKGALGECAGASGALQATAATLALRDGVAPPTVGLCDPMRPLLAHVRGECHPARLRAVLIDSVDCFGFASAIVLRVPESSEEDR